MSIFWVHLSICQLVSRAFPLHTLSSGAVYIWHMGSGRSPQGRRNGIWSSGHVRNLGLGGCVLWQGQECWRSICRVRKHVLKFKQESSSSPRWVQTEEDKKIHWGLTARRENCSRQGIHFQKCGATKFWVKSIWVPCGANGHRTKQDPDNYSEKDSEKEFYENLTFRVPRLQTSYSR